MQWISAKHASWMFAIAIPVSTSVASSSGRKILEMLHKLGKGLIGRSQQPVLKV